MAINKISFKSKKRIEFPAKVKFARSLILPPQRKLKKKTETEQKQQQQQYLKQRFSSRVRIQEPQQRVWRKIFVLTKPKSKVRLPRLFRTDQRTGLPVDYERTVSKIMHYVNPKLFNSPQPHQVMRELLTRTLAGIMEDWNYTKRCPHHIRQHIRKIMKGRGPPTANRQQHDDNLSEFHSACKRGPVMPEPLAPTYKSRFNYNNLKIQSK